MLSTAKLAGVALQLALYPSPAAEDTRCHDRLSQTSVPGRRVGHALQIGHPGSFAPVIIHFHGDTWVPEQTVADAFPDVTVVAINIGLTADIYHDAFQTPAKFHSLLKEIGAGNRPIFLTAYSAGYGAVRAILRHSYERIDSVLLMDGLHTEYVKRDVNPAALDVFLQFARDSALGRKRMLITHSEVFPGNFASTTEATDWLVHQLNLHRLPALQSGPGGMQQLSEVREGRLAILGFAGGSGPDHADHLYGMSTWLHTLRKM